jgi:hypothetical protein
MGGHGGRDGDSGMGVKGGPVGKGGAVRSSSVNGSG